MANDQGDKPADPSLTDAPPGKNDPMGPEPTEQTDRQAMAVDLEQPPKLAFPVVGIGASAGGVEAVTEFVSAMRPDSGMAFVFIQHLPPDGESMMADILSKKTRMTVLQVEEGMGLKPDHVYCIRPGHVLTIKDGRFHLGPQLGKRHANRPIDDFFKSLAEEQRERAICIILSGMGSNGSAGAQAVKAVGGLAIAQDPETAQYPSMPRHLIDQGYADYILRPSDMPDVLLQYAGHPYANADAREKFDEVHRNENHVREILAILRTQLRTDFNGYKKPTVVRRIQRRMGLTRLTEMGEYAKVLRQSPSEVRSLADDLLIHVTGFFRDPEAWEVLRQKVVAPLVARREPESEIRAWVTACSSGEEAYSLAMMIVEEAERQNKPLGIKVFATDLAERPLVHARQGLYPGGIESEVDPHRLERFFDRDEGLYRIKPFLRECVVFAPQNVLQDPPFSRLDIISCRNLLIYLEPEMQERILNLLHFGLREGGALFLGSSETVGGAEELYELIDKRARLYRRVGPTRHGQLDFPLPHTIRGAGQSALAASAAAAEQGRLAAERRLGAGRPSIALITQRTLLDQHVRAAVTVDRDNRVLYFHGDTRSFLQHPSGEPTRDLMILVRDGLRGSVRVAIHRCAAEQKAVTVLDGWLEMAEGRFARVSVTASAVSGEDPGSPDYFVVSFEELDESRGGPPGSGNGNGNGDAEAAAETETELRRVRDELQTTIEELQTSNEELKASHEEVTSINEELQSSNEELETSKEEMQSLNEELTTVNAQLGAKMEELQGASNDLSALLASTTIAVLFLDTHFRIRRFTPATRELMELIQGDVGRPISDMHRKFDDPHLEEDARAVLERLVPVEREVSAENGRTYDRRVLPYRTVDNRIDGVVVTFFDITRRKEAERNVAEAREYAESIVETTHEPLLVMRPDLTVRSANGAFYRHFKVNESETVGRKIYKLGDGQWDIPALRKALEEVLPTNKVFEDYEVVHTFKGLGRRVMLLNGRRLDHVQLILLGIRDVTVERDVTEALRASEARFKRMSNVPGLGVLTFDVDTGALIDANETFLTLSGYTREQVDERKLTWRDLTPPEFVAESERQMGQMRETGRIGPYEKDYLLADGTRSRMLFAGAAVGDGTAVEYCIDLGGISSEAARARESEERFRLIVENVHDYGIFMADASGIITSWNPGAERIFGYTHDEAIGLDARVLLTPEDQATAEHEKELELARQEGRASDDRWQMRKNGERFWAAGVTSAMRGAAGNVIGFIKIVRDETQRKQSEQQLRQDKVELERRVAERTETMATHQRQLRSLVAELGRSEIRQRRMLAAELHDNLAQLLAVCKLKVSSIEAALPTDSRFRQDAAMVKDSLGEAIAYTRALLTDLRPDVLDENDVQAAIEWVAKRMARHGLKVEVADDGQSKPVDQEVLGFLFQAVRELLWNVVKHARATEAIVTIGRGDRNVSVTVEDAGVGFDATRQLVPSERGGFGLFSIAERIGLLGGRLDVQSRRRKGTTITLTVPVDSARA
jgi:PAS domain S-box-containing protein